MSVALVHSRQSQTRGHEIDLESEGRISAFVWEIGPVIESAAVSMNEEEG